MLYKYVYIAELNLMPKQRITKEMILEVAFKLARERGYEQVVVKNIAAEMGCSVQPIYSYFSNMDALKQAVVGAAMQFYNGFIYSRVDNDRVLQSIDRKSTRLNSSHP